jgi:hypothetical protein
MVCRYMAFFYVYLHSLTGLSYDFSQSNSNLASHYGFSIFGYPYDMVFNIVDGVWPFSVGSHTWILPSFFVTAQPSETSTRITRNVRI